MKISKENQSKLLALLKEKNVKIECKECGTGICGLKDNEYQIISYDRTEKGLAFNSKYFFEPVMSIQCNNCGSIRYFNLFTLLGPEALKNI